MRGLALVACLLAVSTLEAQRSPGPLLIAGGGPQPPALVQKFVDLAGGKGRARVVVFAMASAEGATSGEEKANDLRALGAEARNVWITRAQADVDSIVHLLDGVTGIWFGGGDQTRLIAALRGSRVDSAMHARWRAGAVIGGTSAGAAVMSEVMITGDERHPGGARPDTSVSFGVVMRDDIVTDAGFGFIRSAIVDQHFLRRKRHNRLISLVLERAPHLAVGIDESTAILVDSRGTWTVLGASAAIVYDARRARVTPSAAPVLGATGILMHVLPAGSTYDPRSGVARMP